MRHEEAAPTAAPTTTTSKPAGPNTARYGGPAQGDPKRPGIKATAKVKPKPSLKMGDVDKAVAKARKSTTTTTTEKPRKRGRDGDPGDGQHKRFQPYKLKRKAPFLSKGRSARIPLQDKHGLDTAYAAKQNAFLDRDGTLYVAGTKDVHDVMDWPKLPLGQVKKTARYKEVMDLLNGRRPTRVVGHSLGASVANALAKEFDIPSTLIANPGFAMRKPRSDQRRIRHTGDPVAMFDRAAEAIASSSWNTHQYADFAPNPGLELREGSAPKKLKEWEEL